jgi:hypothetical protein
MINPQIYLLLQTDGQVRQIVSDGYLSLQMLKEHVSGNIRVERMLVAPDLPEEYEITIVMNENGKLKNLPSNPFMTEMYGNILIARSQGGELTGLTRGQLRGLQETIQDIRNNMRK